MIATGKPAQFIELHQDTSTYPSRCDPLLLDEVTNASWKSKASWYLVAAEDKMIPPDAQRAMAGCAGATDAK